MVIVVFALLLFLWFTYQSYTDGLLVLLYELGLLKLFYNRSKRGEIEKHLLPFEYFTKLSPSAKVKFVDRVIVFLIHKEFVGIKGLEVTEEMKVLISASAVQLTFGLKRYKIETLSTIYIAPDLFKLKGSKDLYKGATKRSSMYLSWSDFQKGYQDNDDKINLGLHEMAHALRLTLTKENRFDKKFLDRTAYWDKLMQEKISLLKVLSFSLLRPYSKANSEEFFAVAVESFFESPHEFEQKLPELYAYMVFLLNQNPINASGDYKVEPDYFQDNPYDLPSLKKVEKSYRFADSHWSMYVTGFGTVLLVVALISTSGIIILSKAMYVLLYLIFTGLVVPKRRFFTGLPFLPSHYFSLYKYFGFAPLLLSLVLLLNAFFPVTDIKCDKHKINNYRPVYDSYGSSGRFLGWKVELEDESEYSNSVLTLPFRPQDHDLFFNLYYRYGLLGIKNYHHYSYSQK